MRFPHLEDTRFPNIEQVNVYEFQNNFDYTRWSEKTIVRLCNVLWNSDYLNVVKFPSDSARDTWFDSLDGLYEMTLQTSARVVPEGFVKLPIPYDVMARYNYLYIDMPIATSADHMIDYENNGGTRRWYFFIDRVAYLSPNTTQCFIQPDVWTIYQNSIDIRYLLLERGHAPVSVTDTDTYLANPIANNRYLLAPDVTFDNAAVSRSSQFVPFGNGTKYVCIASTCAPSMIASLGAVYLNDDYDPPSPPFTYHDLEPRYGHQLEVEGFSIGMGRDFTTANTPVAMGTSNNNRIANNLTVYAIAATECYGNGTFYADVIALCPQFLNTVQACFVVDESCITKGTAYSIAGHTLYTCVGNEWKLLDKQLAKADFSYPTELQRFAKLYTSPYAQLEITDNDGTTYSINIEETTTLTAKAVVSVAFPYINMRIFFEGIGGVSSNTYTWRDLAGNSATRTISDSDWFKFCFDWRIPTFALYMDGSTAHQLATFNRAIKQGINNALVTYHNTMRSANTAYNNAFDSANTAKLNADNSANAAYVNAYNSADAGYNNSLNSADAGNVNAKNVANASYQNSLNLANTANANAGNTAVLGKSVANNNAALAKQIADDGNTVSYSALQNAVAGQQYGVQHSNYTTEQNSERNILAESRIIAEDLFFEGKRKDNVNSSNQSLVSYQIDNGYAATQNSANATMASSIWSGASGGAVLGMTGGFALGSAIAPGPGSVAGTAIGALGGAISGGISGAISATTIKDSYVLTQRTDVAATNLNIALNSANYNNTVTNTNYNQGEKVGAQRDVVSNNQVCAENQNTVSNNMSLQNGVNSYNVTAANARDTKEFADQNALDTYNFGVQNASNSYNAASQNAANTKDYSDTNADNTQTVAYRNAQNTYDVAHANADNDKLTTNENARNTRDTAQANSNYTWQVEELNAKELLENAANAAMAPLLDARNMAPIKYGAITGNPDADYNRTRGVQIKVKTQSDSAIRQAGDIFARYGYALNQIWDAHSSGLTLMNHFTYWKAAEIWIDDSDASNNKAIGLIEDMFLRGVTVWSDPTKIGKVNVYTN